MNKSSTVIVSNTSLVKQMVFTIEILPFKEVIASLISTGISLFPLQMQVCLRARVLTISVIVYLENMREFLNSLIRKLSRGL